MREFSMLAPVLAPLCAAFLLPITGLISRRLIPLVCLLAMSLSLAGLLLAAGPVFVQGQTLVYWMGGWEPVEGMAVGINFAVDAWGLFIALTIAVVGLLALIYSIPYMAQETGKEAYYILLMLLQAAMLGFVLTGDLFNQFVWLEVLSFSAFALTAFHYRDRLAVEGAFKYLITNSVAAVFILVALAILYATTGALNLAAATGQFGRSAGQMIALGLLFAGYATKTALVPWHQWLPDAYQAAPVPVVAVFSGALSKVGIYAIGRLLFTITPQEFNATVGGILLALAALTMSVGGIQMLRQESIKRILAYSSVAQMGYILLGLAVGSPLGIAAAVLHVLSHALAETALFFGAGAIRLRAGVSDLSAGSGLLRQLPLTFGLMVVAGLSLSGVPLTIGFISKTMLEESAVEEGAVWIGVVAIVCSAFTFAGIGRMLWRIFLREGTVAGADGRTDVGEGKARGAGESHPLMLFALAIPVMLSVLLGVLPGPAIRWFGGPAAVGLLEPAAYVGSVLTPAGGTAATSAALTVDMHAPSLLNWASWLAPVFVVVAGTALAYFSLPENERRLWELPAMRGLSTMLSRWHSGLLSDYLLWSAFSTSVLLVLLVLLISLQFRPVF